MKFEFFCNDGSPIGIIPEDIDTRGVGGAELALFSLCETLVEMDHEVVVFNNPRIPGQHRGIEFRPNRECNAQNPGDVFVLFRSPNLLLLHTEAPVKLFWSCDQQTIGNYMRHIFPFVDQIVTISRFHRDYHIDRWKADPEKTTILDLGVRLSEYERNGITRVKGQAIFCSVPDRGLEVLRDLWNEIVEQVPNAQLKITSDYTLWGAPRPLIHRYRMMMARSKNVDYLGKVPREELVRLQLESDIMAYPCIYDELFCIAAAECQVAGAIPITSDCGALSTTNINGVNIPGNPASRPWQQEFVKTVVQFLTHDTEEIRSTVQTLARERFDWIKIANQWIEMVERIQKQKGVQ